jgi:hypothetical protein
MSDLQLYYDYFRTGYWADPDPQQCLCRGRGWALSDVDTWHKCPCHYKGQLHPEEYIEDPKEWDRANRESIARHTGKPDPVLIEAGLQLPSGEVACRRCGDFGHKEGCCPPACSECGDGWRYPSSECPRCREEVVGKQVPPPPVRDDEEIPF